jgi:hypothetical protein
VYSSTLAILVGIASGIASGAAGARDAGGGAVITAGAATGVATGIVIGIDITILKSGVAYVGGNISGSRVDSGVDFDSMTATMTITRIAKTTTPKINIDIFKYFFFKRSIFNVIEIF